MAENEEKIFLRVSASLKDAWKKTTRARKIDQNEAARALIDWINRQDDQVQLMIFGQAEPRPDLVELVLSRLVREKGAARGRDPGKIKVDAN